jgi:hypothetical protein
MYLAGGVFEIKSTYERSDDHESKVSCVFFGMFAGDMGSGACPGKV